MLLDPHQDGGTDSPFFLATVSKNIQCKHVHSARSYTNNMFNILQLKPNKTDFSVN